MKIIYQIKNKNKKKIFTSICNLFFVSEMPTPAPLQFTNCPDDITQPSEYGKDTYSVNWQLPRINYPEYEIQSSYSSPLTVKVGDPVNVTYTATGGGETIICFFTITVLGNYSNLLLFKAYYSRGKYTPNQLNWTYFVCFLKVINTFAPAKIMYAA